jgi:porphobilinogen synthase
MYPVFVDRRIAGREEIPSMPGVYRLSNGDLEHDMSEVSALRIPAVMVFGIPDRKDPFGREAYAKDGIVQQTVRTIKETSPDLVVATDVCLCQYTDHGHCGIVEGGVVSNDKTLELLARIAISHAEAGADIVAPSAMMDGQVKAIRSGLDDHGFYDMAIMAYSAKFASAFYGPFREAAESAPMFGDRRAYQMDPPNLREAMREIEIDVKEGADIVMVKPALSYLDVIMSARETFRLTIAAYNVSGEYAMVKSAARNGWLDEKSVVLEILTSIKRAGADIVITYFAKQAATWLQEVN